MSSSFPKAFKVEEKNRVIGDDFVVVKKNPMESFSDSILKFSHDRLIPSRQTNTNTLMGLSEGDFDITCSKNNLSTMKKSQYQNALKSLFHEVKTGKDMSKERNAPLIHLDWTCKLTNIRQNFLPDFETLEKRSFHLIHNYIWSSKHLIAASSDKKVCLYHPMNGFTRALDIYDSVVLAFASSGDFLAMAYKKSRRGCHQNDLYLFQTDNKALFQSEKLLTEKTITMIKSDITAMCFTRNDQYLLCGTDLGEINVFETQPKLSKLGLKKVTEREHSWILTKTLSETHTGRVIKICFSATARYLATLDCNGEFKIWNGGSWTYMFSYQHEKSLMYKHFEWHPFVDSELVFGRKSQPALYLFNVTEKQVVASFAKANRNYELTSIAFNPVNAQLAVCFYDRDEYINRVSLLASMSQVISSFDFDYIRGPLKLFWNNDGMMLGAGARIFRFAFWSFYKDSDLNLMVAAPQSINAKKKREKLPTLSESKMLSLR